jgi:hypothetical protein
VTVPTIVGSGVKLDATGIRLGDQPQLLLCASLFYFRLPREEWQDRLAQVRASGYTCVDVYFPWNFHETAPGEWSFAGRRDIAAFLDLAHAEGLSVIARPGPYICSEWDGGALPAWLGLDPQLRVRQHEPRFLAQVSRWFDQVLPILAERQYPAGGPIIMVQLENELDFFDCTDRAGYLTALRDQAIAHGITVPLIACAGQGDLAGATGDVAGIVPACNFYPDDDSADIEAEVRHYAHLLAARGLPLLVTETNRSHRTLRRLLASGASLLGPYLQSSGWNFGYTPSTGNWGTPGNLMSHSYDFGGYVSSTGTERPGYAEARVLARVLDTLGSRLARSTTGAPGVEVTTDFPTSSAPAALNLAGGGRILALPNLGTEPGTAILSGRSVGRLPVAVPADACPLLLLDLPLRAWGADLTMALASADLVAAASDGGAVALAFSSDVPVTVVLDGIRGTRVDGTSPEAGGSPAEGAGFSRNRGTVVIPAGGSPVRRVVTGTDREGTAVTVTLVVLTTADAARLAGLHADGRPEFGDGRGCSATATGPAPREMTTAWRRGGGAPARAAGAGYQQPPSLESLGVYRGRGTYAATVDLTDADDLLLVGAADLVDLSIAGRARPCIAGFGATERIDVRDVSGRVDLQCTVEIWGHPNFDDSRLPALRLGGLRGLGTLWKVTGSRDLSAHWRVGGADQWADDPPPVRSLGGWSSTRVGRPITYTRALHTGPDTVSALHLAGLAVPVAVAVDDGEPVTVHAENPWVPLPAGSRRVSLTMPHDPSGAQVRPELLTLRPVTGWSCTAQDDRALLGYAQDGDPDGERVDLPLALEPGGEVWLDVDLPAGAAGWLVHLDGSQVRATGWVGEECLGRVWLADPQRPRFSGGDPGVLWVPASWCAAGTRLTLLLRGTAGPAEPVLTALRLVPARS